MGLFGGNKPEAHLVKQGYTLCGKKAPLFGSKGQAPWYTPKCGVCVSHNETLPWWRRH